MRDIVFGQMVGRDANRIEDLQQAIAIAASYLDRPHRNRRGKAHGRHQPHQEGTPRPRSSGRNLKQQGDSMFTIYKMTNTQTGRSYIGVTMQKLQGRYGQHLYRLRSGCHPNDGLLADYVQGKCSLTITAIKRVEDKSAAFADEQRLISREANPYNIRRGKPGDMSGRVRRRHHNPTYFYAEVNALRGKATNAEIARRMECSGSLVSMVHNGWRCAPAPDTTFGDVLCDMNTLDKVLSPPPSQVRARYARGGN